VLVFIVVFVNNIGVPLPGETILLGAGFVLGKATGSLWQPMAAGTAACFLGGNCAFWMGRRLNAADLKKIHWLHLTSERLKWPQRYFKRHGAKAVFIARFIAIFPPAAGNVLAGMTKMSWQTFLFYNLTGSAGSTVGYILMGYFFGMKWKFLKAWLGPTWLCLICGGVTIVVLCVVFRQFLLRFFASFLSRKSN
jgi:membrane protein DedA with SNARE-associated domain